MGIFKLHHSADIFKFKIYYKEMCMYLSLTYQSSIRSSIHPSIHVYQYGLMGYLYSIVIHSSIYFDTQTFPGLISGIPLQAGSWGLLTWLRHSSVFNHTLIFWHSRMFQAYLDTFPAPDLGSTIFLMNSGSFEWKTVFKIKIYRLSMPTTTECLCF